MSGALHIASSSAALAPDNPSRRLPRPARRPRADDFFQAFDDRTLFYDCFWHADGERVLLVGPPPVNLKPAFAAAQFAAEPGNIPLRRKFFASLSTMVTALSGMPADATHVAVTLGGERFRLAIQPNHCRQFAGRRLLFSINKDNDLGWIREWAEFHAKVHGTDAVVLFDNGSTRYAAAEVLEALAAVPGIAFAAVPEWRHSFGPIDGAVRANPFWSRFLQIGAMSTVLRRFGEHAFGLLDCDVDELAGTRSGRSIYELAKQSRGGLVAFRGVWVEATGEGRRHRDFVLRRTDPKAALSRPRKWALDPRRAWVRRLSVHPYWHWIEGRPPFSKSMPEDALYWHFRAINTNWKLTRSAPPPNGVALEADALLAARFESLAA